MEDTILSKVSALKLGHSRFRVNGELGKRHMGLTIFFEVRDSQQRCGAPKRSKSQNFRMLALASRSPSSTAFSWPWWLLACFHEQCWTEWPPQCTRREGCRCCREKFALALHVSLGAWGPLVIWLSIVHMHKRLLECGPHVCCGFLESILDTILRRKA